MNSSSPFPGIALAAMLALLPAVVGAAAAPGDPAPSRPLVLQSAVDAPPQPAEAGLAAIVTLGRGEAPGERIAIELPGGTTYEAVVEARQALGEGRYSWTGHADGDPASRVVLGISGDAVAGAFVHEGRLFKLDPRPGGAHVIRAVSAVEPAPERDPLPVDDAVLSGPAANAGSPAAAGDSAAVIDVLVAYTTAVRAVFGTQGSEALAILAVAEANQAYANSGMSTRLNLVHSSPVNYDEAQDISTDLARLSAPRDGFMDGLHALRDYVGADVVSLIADQPAACGLAYRMATLSAGFEPYAFSVVHHDCATGYYSFAHEVSHNLGAHHDYANATGTALFPYAYGYQDPAGAFRTVMALNCPGGCPRVAHFSRSGIDYDGKPTGTPYLTENAYAIDQAAPTVAGFRAGPSPPPGC